MSMSAEDDTSKPNNDDDTLLQHLIKTLEDTSNDERIRWEAIEALGKLGNLEALEVLMVALADEVGSVRYSAAVALGELGDKGAVPGLLEVLRRPDEHEGVVQGAGLALARLGTEALALLIEAFHDPYENSMLRTYVASAIGEIGLGWQKGLQTKAHAHPLSQPQSPLPQPTPTQLSFDAEPTPDEVALSVLLTTARQEDFNWTDLSVRINIVQGLGAVGRGNREVVELLSRVLRRENEDIIVRCETAWALGRLGGSEARQELVTMARLVEDAQAGSEGEMLRKNIEVALEADSNRP